MTGAQLLSGAIKVLKAIIPNTIPQIVLFVVALGGFLDGRRQRAKMEQIAEGTSTRFIGQFPKHLVDLTALADHAHHEILIMTDCIDYGSFFAPEVHRDFVRSIENARSPVRKVSVRILICGSPADFTRASEFHGVKWTDLCQDKKFQKHFDHYVETYPGDSLFLKTEAGFSRALAEAQVSFEKRFGRLAVDIGKLPSEHTDLFLWIADSDHAVFLFPPDVGARMPGLAFQTRDSRLISKNFIPMFEQKWKKWLARAAEETDG